jgi:uncharacterized protein
MAAPDVFSRPGAARRLNVMVPTRDGVRLATDLFLPPGWDEEPLPVLLLRTPYGKANRVASAARYVDAGYVVAVQDVRGRGDSDGMFTPMFQEGPDGYDAIEWLAGQPWCNGAVGTMGGSYEGWAQWAAARELPPHLQAMAVSVTAGKVGRQEIWHHGTVLLTALNWLAAVSGRVVQQTWLSDWRAAYEHLPLAEMPDVLGRDLPLWREWLEHPAVDHYWEPLVLHDKHFAEINVPVLHVSGWYDGNVWATTWFYEQMRAHSPAADRQALVLGPWDHRSAAMETSQQQYGDHDFGVAACVDLAGARVAWFDRWLKGDVDAVPPTSRVFVTGADTWRAAESWPRAQETASWFLAAHGCLDTTSPGEQGQDEFRYDPAKPLVLYEHWDVYGPATNAEVVPREDVRVAPELGGREDVLLYESDPLADAMLVVGNARAVLHAATDGPDTDWFVWLHDVDQRGTAVDVAHGQLRARFHRSLEREELLDPGRVYELVLELSPMAHRFAPGHRLRVVVASSNFPRYDRNLNTGGRLGFDTEMRVATNTVHHAPGLESRVELPVVSS